MSPCASAAAWHVHVCDGVGVNAVHARANPLRPTISARVLLLLLLLLLSLCMQVLIQVTCDVVPGLHVAHASSVVYLSTCTGGLLRCESLYLSCKHALSAQ
jgi:hypothetical protein